MSQYMDSLTSTSNANGPDDFNPKGDTEGTVFFTESGGLISCVPVIYGCMQPVSIQHSLEVQEPLGTEVCASYVLLHIASVTR